MSLTPKAVIAQVPVGNLTIEGLMAEDGTFGIAVPQLVSHHLVSHDNSNREVKTYMGAGSNLVKWRTEISKRPVNVILLIDFERLLAKLDRSGNKSAQDMRDNLVGLALTQLFSDAFGLKFEKEDRQKWLKNRQLHQKQFHPLYTSWLKKDGITTTYGTKVNELKERSRLPLISIDEYDPNQLQRLNASEIVYDALRRSGKSHAGALELVIGECN